MDNITDLITQGTDAYNIATAWVVIAVAYVSGLFADFKGYSSSTKILVIACGLFALIIVMTALQAMFG